MTACDDGPDRSWMALAACRGLDPEAFFPANDKTIHADVETACAVCTVKAECLEYALRTRSAGIWAGMTEDERRTQHRNQLRRERSAEQVA
jgi:WhiB family redox-sensing transcriptional regulator